MTDGDGCDRSSTLSKLAAGFLALGVLVLAGCQREAVVRQYVDQPDRREHLVRRAVEKARRAPAPGVSKTANDYLREGDAHLEKRQYDGAIEAYSKAIVRAPHFVTARHRRGIAYFEKHEYVSAILDFDEVLSLMPEVGEGYYYRGQAYALIGKSERAIRDLDEVIRLEPENANAFFHRGNAYYALENYDRALSDLNRAIDLNPNHYLAFNNRGLVRYYQGDYNGAIRDFTRVLIFAPKDVRALVNRCWAHALMGRAERARADCEEVLAINDKIPESYDAMAFVLWQLGREDESLEALATARSMDPDYQLPQERFAEFPLLLAQALLKAAGYHPGMVDGEMGPQTVQAISAFQRDRGMAVTGDVSPPLLERLRQTPVARHLWQ